MICGDSVLQLLMNKLIAVIHGILTGQTEPSWPDRFDAWIFQRDPQIKVLKKEYRAGPFPRWNCWVKDPFLARGLANEIALFLGRDSHAGTTETAPGTPRLWLVAHSNGAVIALLAAGLLIERGFRIEGLILTGAACESDIERNGILDWQGRGMLGVAISYSSHEDKVLEDNMAGRVTACAPAPLPMNHPHPNPFPSDGSGGRYPKVGAHGVRQPTPTFSGLGVLGYARRWLWGKLLWPYGRLGRTGWTLEGRPLSDTNPELSTIRTRWFAGGHAVYFTRENSGYTFERIYQDIRGTNFE